MNENDIKRLVELLEMSLESGLTITPKLEAINLIGKAKSITPRHDYATALGRLVMWATETGHYYEVFPDGSCEYIPPDPDGGDPWEDDRSDTFGNLFDALSAAKTAYERDEDE